MMSIKYVKTKRDINVRVIDVLLYIYTVDSRYLEFQGTL